MSRLDEGFAPPTACVQWCQLRSYELNVLDDGVAVDLDGWLEDPAVTGFTRRRYDRYLELLTGWSNEIGTRPELVEMWLVQRWSARLHLSRDGSFSAPTLF